MERRTGTVRIKVVRDSETTRKIIAAARVQRSAFNHAIEWLVKAQQALTPDTLEGRLRDEKAKGHQHLKNENGNRRYGGLVRASQWFTGWLTSTHAKRPDGRVPFESSERAERYGRIWRQTVRGLEITAEGTIRYRGTA